jgi:protein-disulfide isomerase
MLFKRAIVTLSLALSAAFLAVTWQGRVLAEDDLAQMLDRMDALADRLDALDTPPPAPAPKPRPERLDPDLRYRVDLLGWNRGPLDAPVVIVEYVDLQCPFCKRAQGTLALLQEKYPQDVRVVFKHNPLAFHKDARPAARMLECAGEQGEFWRTQEALWQDIRALGEEDLRAHARRLELDEGRLDACLASTRPDVAIDDDVGEAKALLARGTPTFFVNGRPIVGAQPFQKFDAVIAEELAAAEREGLRDRRWPLTIIDREGVTPSSPR